GAGICLWVGTIRGSLRSEHRHEGVRGFGATQRIAAEVRVRSGPCDRGRQEATGQALIKMKGISMTTAMSADSGKLTISSRPLSPEELRKMNDYWRAANYLSVGQIYLYANP